MQNDGEFTAKDFENIRSVGFSLKKEDITGMHNYHHITFILQYFCIYSDINSISY